MEWSGVEWSGVDWTGLDWNGVWRMEWTGLDWTGMEFLRFSISGNCSVFLTFCFIFGACVAPWLESFANKQLHILTHFGACVAPWLESFANKHLHRSWEGRSRQEWSSCLSRVE